MITEYQILIIRNWNCAHSMACEAYSRRDTETVDAIIQAMQYRAARWNNGERQAAVEKELENCINVREVLAKELFTNEEDRAAAREKAAARKVSQALADAALNWSRFHVEHPAIAAWMVESAATGFEFAISLRAAVEKWGDLSVAQRKAAEKCCEMAAERKIRLQNAAITAPSVDVAKLEQAFSTAKSSGLKWPKMNLGRIVISPAGANSRNPGALYVKSRDDGYLGKVQGGQFFASRDCSDDQRDAVVELLADPQGYAEAHGKLTGNCCICSRDLTDPVSVARGIGPICASRFGW